MLKITSESILMGRISVTQLDATQASNLSALESRLNKFFEAYTGELRISSGYRSPEVNAKLANAGKKSWHLQCAACDFSDANGKLWAYCIQNLKLASDLGLWLEDKRWTPTWVHLQIYPPASGKRIFAPSTKPPTAPQAFDGVYDSKLDSKVFKT
jgi:hypothetical protein